VPSIGRASYTDGVNKWPKHSTLEGRLALKKKGPSEVHKLLVQLFEAKKLQNQIEQSIIRFCKERPATVEPIQSRFSKLADILIKNEKELHGTTTDISAYSHLRPLPRDVYPDEVHKLLLDGVKSQASCVQHHLTSESKHSAEAVWHLTRLSLDSGLPQLQR
jgi:DNA phosphorothioation-dependent restriction protein DptG